MIIKHLKNVGLNENEANFYLAALELGEANISRISKKANIKRTTAYWVVDSLKERGLISSIKKGIQTKYHAEDPRKIEEMLEEKKISIQKIMPELMSFANLIDKKPKIRYFEGKEAFKEVFKDILKYPSSEVLAWFDENFASIDQQFFFDYFVPKRKEKKIWARVIYPDNPQTRELVASNQEHLIKSKLATSTKFKMDIEINLYGKNKMGIISYPEQLAIIIESQKIFDAQKNIFELLWDNLPEIKIK